MTTKTTTTSTSSLSATRRMLEELEVKRLHGLFSCIRCGREVSTPWNDIDTSNAIHISIPPERGKVRPKTWSCSLCSFCMVGLLRFLKEKEK